MRCGSTIAYVQDPCAQFRGAWDAQLLLGCSLAQAEQFVVARFERELMPTLVIRRFGGGGGDASFFRALEF